MTPHISAQLDEIAKTVVLFGDPTAAHDLAYKFLTNVKKVSDIRYACFFTGTFKGKQYTFGTSGMGATSAAIYVYELYDVYKVERIIRAGSCGAYSTNIKPRDTVLVKEVFSETKTLSNTFLNGQKLEVIEASQNLNTKLLMSAEKLNYRIPVVRAHSLDVLYYTKQTYKDMMEKSQANVVEMEAYTLFFHAKLFNKEAACLLVVVNNLYPTEEDTWLSQNKEGDIRYTAIEIILNADL